MPWMSWTNVGLGIWLVFSAFVFRHPNGDAVVEDIVAGLFVALAAIWAARAYRPSVSVVASMVVALSGLWVLAAPFALGYERPRPSVANDVVSGCAIVALGLTNLRVKGQKTINA
jgi:hypothetical protein